MTAPMVSVPVEPTKAMLKAAHAAILSDIPPDGESLYGPTISTHAIYRAYWAAMLNAAPSPQPVQGEAVTYGLRRKGSDEIIGVIPAKIHERPPTEKWFAEKYEEVPLYLHPPAVQIAAPGGVEREAVTLEQFIIDNIDAQRLFWMLRDNVKGSDFRAALEGILSAYAALRSQGQADAVR